jgi:hypothetical protein
MWHAWEWSPVGSVVVVAAIAGWRVMQGKESRLEKNKARGKVLYRT